MDRLAPERAVLWMPMDGQYDVAGVRSTRNLGRAFGAPEHVIVGNGATATTFPAQRSPRGMYFNGGSYCRLPFEPFLNVTYPYTLAAIVSEPNPNTAFSIIDSMDVALPNIPGCSLLGIGAHRLASSIYCINGTNTFAQASTAMPTNVQRVNFYCTTYDGMGIGYGIYVYANGRNGTDVQSGGMVTGSFVSGQGFGIGCRWNGGAPNLHMIGTGYCFAIYPYALTPNEVFELEYRMRQLRTIP